MKILKIIHGYPPEYNAGSEVYSQSICEALAERHEVLIFTREENPFLPDYALRSEQIGPRIRKVLVNKKIDKDQYRHPEVDAALAKILAAERFDVAHIGHLNHLSTGIVATLRAAKVPIVFTLHDFWLMCPRGQFLRRDTGLPSTTTLCDKQDDATCAKICYGCYFSGQPDAAQRDLDYWTGWVADRMLETKQLCASVDAFIAPSRYLMRRFVDDFGLPAAKVHYLDYGFPLHYLRPMVPKKREIFTFGYIGTHIPAKGVNELITAFARLSQPAKLIIWGRHGGQTTKYLYKLSEGYDIEFRGEYVNKNLAEEVFAEVDAIVVPSIWGENSPLVIHEAQACRVPVITADFGGMSEYVQHLANGLLFKHRDTADLAEKLAFAAANPAIMADLGARGYLYADEVPEIGAHCAALEAIYKAL